MDTSPGFRIIASFMRLTGRPSRFIKYATPAEGHISSTALDRRKYSV